MFNNLIESSSHVREYKRRGSFLLFTTMIYVVLFAVSGVVAIYAYDARLEKQSMELNVTLVSPQEIVPEQPPVVQPGERQRGATENDIRLPQREQAMADVDQPEVVPEKVSAAPNTKLPVPKGPYTIGPSDLNPQPAGGNSDSDTGRGKSTGQPKQSVPVPDNPPPPDPPKQPKIVSRGPITGEATHLPTPVYSELAKRMRVQGVVRVQVVVGLDGRVESATVLNGSPYLRSEAQRAAMQARFKPTTLNDLPVKVSGVIIYNFQLH